MGFASKTWSKPLQVSVVDSCKELHRLARNKSGSTSAKRVLLCRDPARQAGAIKSLLQLLTSSSPAVQDVCAESISTLACSEEQIRLGVAPAAMCYTRLSLKVCMTCREALMGAGAIQPLVLMLSSSRRGIQESCARAISSLSDGWDKECIRYAWLQCCQESMVPPCPRGICQRTCHLTCGASS